MSPLILNLDTRSRRIVSFLSRSLYAREVTAISTEYEAGWTLEPVWKFWRRDKPLASAKIRTPDGSVRSEPLYLLRSDEV